MHRRESEPGIVRAHRLVWLAAVGLLMAWWPAALDEGTRIMVLALLVALFGLPHGALDPLVARATGSWSSGLQLTLHLIAYVGLACAVLLLWWLWPSASLMVFLLISAWHFGDDWRTCPDGRVARAWERGVTGAAVVGAPVLFYPERVSQLFGMLTGQAPDAQAVVLLVESWTLIAIPGIIGTAWLALAHLRSSPAWALELAALVVAAWWFPPLIYFALYFCFLHSPRHLIGLARDPRVGLTRTAWQVAIGLTLITVLAGASAFFVLGEDRPMDTRLVQVIFVTLAALTVPHMWLVERYARGAKRPAY